MTVRRGGEGPGVIDSEMGRTTVLITLKRGGEGPMVIDFGEGRGDSWIARQ